MATSAARKRVGRFGTNPGIASPRFGIGSSNTKISTSRPLQLYNPLLDSFSYHSQSHYRHLSQLVTSNGKRLFLVDTLALVRKLEGQGLPSKQAEAITAVITEVLNDSLENVSQSFVSKAEMQKLEMIQETNLSKFKSEVQSSQIWRLSNSVKHKQKPEECYCGDANEERLEERISKTSLVWNAA